MSDLYQTKEWKSIKVSERAYLLPTMEDVRLGALVRITNPQAESLEYCLQEKGMKSYEKDGLLFISKNESLLESTLFVRNIFHEANSFLTKEEKLDEPYKELESLFHTAMGNFFSYPECCIKDFIESLNNNLLPGNEWHKKARKAIKQGVYDGLFDYRLHVPCGIECKNTPKIAKEIKKCLESHDLEAAEWLKKFNNKILYEE